MKVTVFCAYTLIQKDLAGLWNENNLLEWLLIRVNWEGNYSQISTVYSILPAVEIHRVKSKVNIFWGKFLWLKDNFVLDVQSRRFSLWQFKAITLHTILSFLLMPFILKLLCHGYIRFIVFGTRNISTSLHKIISDNLHNYKNGYSCRLY